MKIEIIQGSTYTISGREKPCAECEEEKNNPGVEPNPLEDRVTLSGKRTSPLEASQQSPAADSASEKKEAHSAAPRSEVELSEEERQLLDQLRSQDREVRAHEQAHKAAAGPYAKGTPTYDYQTGPDGRRYAVGGEVQIDISKVPGNPRATLVKAQTVKRAANAPKNPSAQDRQVAAQAAQLEAEARRELNEQRTQETQAGSDSSTTPTGANSAVAKIRLPPSSQDASSQPTGDSPLPAGLSAANGNTRAHRLIKQFQPTAPPQRGNRLDIIS